jgi:hypothetical protein
MADGTLLKIISRVQEQYHVINSEQLCLDLVVPRFRTNLPSNASIMLAGEFLVPDTPVAS